MMRNFFLLDSFMTDFYVSIITLELLGFIFVFIEGLIGLSQRSNEVLHIRSQFFHKISSTFEILEICHGIVSLQQYTRGIGKQTKFICNDLFLLCLYDYKTEIWNSRKLISHIFSLISLSFYFVVCLIFYD